MRFFFDNNLSPKLARSLDALVRPEHQVVHLKEKFPADTSDVAWMHSLAKEPDWVIISGDLQIRRNPHEIKAWQESERSFWLPTATDRFYPDFVCKLTDGRMLVVEYKGEHLWSNDDSKDKRRLGELWAERSGGRCLFVMPKGKDLQAIQAALKAK